MANRPIFESYWVEEDRFLAGEFPGSYDTETTRRQMDVFLEAGINTFIDLTQPHELVPYEPVLKEQAFAYGIHPFYYRFAIRDHGVPSVGLMQNILNTIDNALNMGDKVYVHCWGGVGRTGITVGCYLVRHGADNEAALIKVNKLYKTRLNSFHFLTSPETEEQINFVRNWREVPPPVNRRAQNFCEG